jgi:hypothetical protein
MNANSENELLGCFFCILLFIVLLVGIAVGGLIGEKVGREATQRQAIKQGAARYNPDNGQFEWKKINN